MRYRVTRRKYLLVTVLWTIPALIIIAMGGGSPEVQVLVYLMFSPVWIWIGIGRLHDMGLSGGWLPLSFIPGINLLFNLVMLLAPPTRGPNPYGPDPRGSAKGRGGRRPKQLHPSV